MQIQSLQEPWKIMVVCHFKSVLKVTLWIQQRIFIDFAAEWRASCPPTPVSMDAVKKVVLLPTQTKNVRPSFSGATGGHSLPENLIWVVSALSLCIQASKYMYMMFRYRPLSLYHQITTALTMQNCSTYYMCNQLNNRFTASDSVHSHTRSRCELYLVFPQREGAHAWKYIHACHSNLQNMLQSTS